MIKRFSIIYLATAIILSSIVSASITFILTSGVIDPSKNHVVRNKETAIGIAEAVWKEKHPELFDEDTSLGLLVTQFGAVEKGDYWLVSGYYNVGVLGKQPITQISKKTGEVIRMFFG